MSLGWLEGSEDMQGFVRLCKGLRMSTPANV